MSRNKTRSEALPGNDGVKTRFYPCTGSYAPDFMDPSSGGICILERDYALRTGQFLQRLNAVMIADSKSAGYSLDKT